MRLLFIDNFVTITSDRTSATAERDKMVADLVQRGVISDPAPDNHDEMLGFALDCAIARWRPTMKKLARFVAAGRFLCRPDKYITGQEFEKHIGQTVHLLGLRTELMC